MLRLVLVPFASSDCYVREKLTSSANQSNFSIAKYAASCSRSTLVREMSVKPFNSQWRIAIENQATKLVRVNFSKNVKSIKLELLDIWQRELWTSLGCLKFEFKFKSLLEFIHYTRVLRECKFFQGSVSLMDIQSNIINLIEIYIAEVITWIYWRYEAEKLIFFSATRTVTNHSINQSYQYNSPGYLYP